MGDLSGKDASQSVILSGANPSTGVETNYLNVDSNGSANVILRDNSGNALGTNTNPIFAGLPAQIDTGNSTNTPLAGNATYTGTWTDVLNASTITVTIFTSHASASNGFKFQTSTNGTDWDDGDLYTISATSAGEAKTYSFGVTARYYRIVYVNGPTLQTAFRLQTIIHYMATKSSSHRIGDSIVDDDDAELVKAVITGKSPTQDYVNVSVDDIGRLQVLATPVESDRFTYSAAATNFAAASTPTDVFTIAGAANKIIKITKIAISARTTSGSGISTAFDLIKRSTLNTGGTSVVDTNVPHDSLNPAASATVRHYTANPSALGTSVGAMRCQRVSVQPSDSPTTVVEWDWGGVRSAQSPILRSATENLAINFGSVTISGNLTCIYVEWTEEDA